MSHRQAALNLPDHEQLSQLARDDPAAFEILCRQVIDDNIDHAPERIQMRLRGLQFRIDGIRRLSRSPLGATVKIYTMMWDSFLQMNQKLQDLVAPATAAPHSNSTTLPQSPLRSARIIEFQRQASVSGELPAMPDEAVTQPVQQTHDEAETEQLRIL